MIIPDYILNIINKIEESGYEAYIVGGCVRDYFLDKTPNDWDITTSALPEDILRIFAQLPTIPTGIRHGTVTVIADKMPVEITTYRIDGEYTDNRRPESVTFSQNITDDLSRRDFTVNAMAFNPGLGLVDPFDGQGDISRGLLKCVGAPQKRFTEDALRIMRALRFSATLGFKTDIETKRAIFACIPLLKNIAAERITAELVQLVTAKAPAPVLDEFTSVFAYILDFDATTKAAVWQKNICCISRCPINPAVRFAVLFDGLYDNFSSITTTLKKLKLDNQTQKTVTFLSNELYTELPDGEIPLKKLLARTSSDLLILTAQAQLAKFPGKALHLQKVISLIEKILDENQCISLKQLDINGNDLKKALGINGKNIGSTLNLLLDAVIEEKCQNTFGKLISYAKNEYACKPTHKK